MTVDGPGDRVIPFPTAQEVATSSSSPCAPLTSRDAEAIARLTASLRSCGVLDSLGPSWGEEGEQSPEEVRALLSSLAPIGDEKDFPPELLPSFEAHLYEE